MNPWRDRLVGPIVSLPTFCDEDYNLLLDRQRVHIRWLLEKGIKDGDGVLLIAGGVGETYMLEDEEFRTLADLVVEEADGRAPTMVMISELGCRRAAAKARYAADAGVDFVLLSPPHYSLPTEDDIFLHHQYVTDAADIGIVLYNSYWVMPGPGYAYSAHLLERFAELENVVGVKWSAKTLNDWLGMQKRFGDRFNFIQNMFVFSFGVRYGMKGFIDMYGNATPRLSLHMWDLLKNGRFGEFDELFQRIRVDPFLPRGDGSDPSWSSVGDGWHALASLKLLGLDAGPAFPGQAPPTKEYVEFHRRALDEGGMMEWADWDQSVFDWPPADHQAGAPTCRRPPGRSVR